MSLDNRFEINKKQAIQSTPTTGSTSVSTSTESTSKAISFENTKKSDPVTETIKNEEFQKLSYEEQLEALKKQFPNIDEKELINTLKTVKSTIEQEQDDVSENPAETLDENISEEEKILNNYAASIGKNDIDEILMHIKTKSPDKLTKEEQVILDYIEKNKEQNTEITNNNPTNEISNTKLQKYIEKYGDKIDHLIDEETLNSPEWKQKSPMEKMNARADALAADLVPNYKNKSEKAKLKIRQELYEKIGKIIDPEWGKWDIEPAEGQTKQEAIEVMKYKKLQMTAIMLDALETSKKPLSTILTKDENVRKEIQKNYAGKLIGVVLSDKKIDVNSPEWNNKTSEEQIRIIADSVLETLNPDYKNLNEEQKAAQREKFINKFAEEFIPNWNQMDDVEKSKAKKAFSIGVSAIKSAIESGEIKDFEDFKKLDINSQLDIVEKYERTHNISIDLEESVVRKTMRDKGTNKISQQDIINTIDKALKNKNLSQDDIKSLEKFKGILEEDINIGGNRTDVVAVGSASSTENDIKKAGGLDSYLNSIAEENGIEIKDIKNNDDLWKRIIYNCNDIKIRKELIEKLGLDPNQIKIPRKMAVRDTAKASIDKNRGNYELSVQELDKCDKKAASKAFKRNTIHFKNHDDRLAIGKLGGQLGYSKEVAESWNNTQYVTTEEGLALGRDFNLSDDISNSAKSTFTKAFIETAENDNIRLEYGRELSKIDNSAVTEGLAAASNSVGEEYRSQYNSYVETAMQNYPPEQQQNIRSAMQTGEISQETLSQTTPPSGKNIAEDNTQASINNRSADNSSKTSGNTQQNSNVVNNASNAATNSAAQSSAAPSRTSVSNSTAASFNNTIDSPTSFTSQLKQESNITEPTYSTSSDDNISTAKTVSHSQYSGIDDDFTTEALEAKKDAAMENIENFQEHVEESVQQSQVTEEDIQTIANLIENPENISISEEDKIRQVFKKVGTNVTAIYNIIINRYGSQVQDKFLEVLASNGSSDNIRSFVNSMRSDPSIIKKLYTHCSNQKLKSELLNMLPINDIILMITAGQIKISDLGTGNYKRVIAELKQSDPEKLNELFGEFESNINDKISSGYSLNDSDRQRLYEYLSSNIQGLSNTKFSRYLQYLPIESREELVAMKNSPKTKTPEQTEDMAESYAQNSPADNNTQAERKAEQPAGFDESQNANNIEKENKESNTQKTAQQNAQPIFKENEMTTVLNDGTKVKRKETFGAISNDTEMYDDYEEVARESATPSMNDPVLTPGSYEWQVKYNKQMAYQPITPPSNMPETDDGILLGSNKVSQRLQIDKMKRKGPFYFNA